MLHVRALIILVAFVAVVIVVIWAYPQIALGLHYAEVPETNKAYDKLFAQARLEMKQSYTNYSRGANSEVWISGLAPNDAVKDLEVKGMRVRKVEKFAMKFFTNKQRDDQYLMLLLGDRPDPDAPPKLVNFDKPVSLGGLDKTQNLTFWNIRAGYVSLEDDKVSHKTLSLVTARLKNVQLDPKWLPRFDRQPVYEWETFRDGICLGVFAAWLSDGFTNVKWTPNAADKNYKFLDGPTAFSIAG